MTMLIRDKSGQILTSNQFKKKYNQLAYSGDFPPKCALDLVGAEFVTRSISERELSAAIRNQRDLLLSDSDWRALSDNTLSPAWASYRQALRDITGQAGFPYAVTWPTKPE